MNRELITLKNISYSYRKNNLVFNDLNLKIKRGRIYALIGNKNSGKTTLLRLILNILKPDEGEVNNGNIKFAYLNSNGGFCEYLTVKENIEHFYQLTNKRKIENVEYYLQKWDLMNDENIQAHKLNNIIQKRLSLALLDLKQADIYILDEPFKNYDDITLKIIKDYITNLVKSHQTIIISTEDYKEYANLIEEYIIIKDQSIRQVVSYE